MYFALFIGYEDDIFEVISNLHVQGSKFGVKFGGKSFFFKLNSAELMEFVFFQVLWSEIQSPQSNPFSIKYLL